MTNIVTAFDAATGRQLWQKPASSTQPLYHTAMSPLVDRGLVIVHVGGHNQGALNALRREHRRGEMALGRRRPGYGSPVAVDVDGTRQIVVFTQENLVGVSAATGELLWKRPFSTSHTQNAITPILYNQTVIVSGLDKGVTAFRIVKKNGGWDTENVWENSDVSLYMTNGVIVNDTLVSLSHKNSGQFFGLDARTGKTVWTSAPRQATNAAITRAGNLLFVLKDDAELIVARLGPKGLETVRTYTRRRQRDLGGAHHLRQPAVREGRRLAGALDAELACATIALPDTTPMTTTTHTTHTRKSMVWLIFVAGAILSWGAYGVLLHQGQTQLGNPLKALLCVGVAYFLIGVIIPVLALSAQGNLSGFNAGGLITATVAGALGAAGAVCIIWAFRTGGLPVYVMPLVFGGAPLVNVLVTMALHPPKAAINPMLYVGFVLASAGAGMVLYFRPTA